MTDPRYQGVAGVVRVVQSLFGVVDSHCVDVDTWRSMSPIELARRHISLKDVERTAHEHGCVPPRRGSVPAIPGRH